MEKVNESPQSIGKNRGIFKKKIKNLLTKRNTDLKKFFLHRLDYSEK
jgi:hypothetical protein